MPDLALQLLGHGVDIAEPAFQRVVLEDRGGTGGIIGEVDRLARLVDGVGSGHANRDALGDRDACAGDEILPDIGHRLQHEAARGAQIDLGLGKPGLHHSVVAKRAPGAPRHLVARDIDEIIERTAGDATGHAGKTDLIASAGAHAIERSAFAAFPIEFAGDRMICPHEKII